MEEWKVVNDYSNYSVSNLGRIKNKNGDIKKYSITNRGYCVIDLYKNNIRKKFTIHQLVAIHFLPNWNNYKEIDHRNQNKLDNRLINLRWTTRSVNLKNKGKQKHCSSQYKGVDNTCWGWRVRIDGKHIGYFKTEDDAYIATL